MNEGFASSNVLKWHRTLFGWTAVMVYVLVLSGGIVCITDSSHGCPDWPACHGRLFPPNQVNSIIEYSHRILTPLTLPFLILTAIVAWRRYRSDRWILIPVFGAILSLLVVVFFRRLGHSHRTPPILGSRRLGDRVDGSCADGDRRLWGGGTVSNACRQAATVIQKRFRQTRPGVRLYRLFGIGQRRVGLQTRRLDALPELAWCCWIGAAAGYVRMAVSHSLRARRSGEHFDCDSVCTGLEDPARSPSVGQRYHRRGNLAGGCDGYRHRDANA